MSKIFPTDTATIQTNLREAANLSDDQLQKMTVVELRDLLRKCGIKQIKRGTINEPVRNAKRQEAVEALALAVSPYKALANAVIDRELVDENIRTLSYPDVLDLLKIAARKPTDPEREAQAREIAVEVNEWICRNYPDTDELLRIYSRCDKRGDYRSQVGSLVAKEGSLMLSAVYGEFAKMLNTLGKGDASAKAKLNRERLDRYESKQRTIDASKLFTWAEKTLADVVPGTKPTSAAHWKSVAIAIAAMTGRRIYSEILTAASQFSVKSDRELEFTGVAKGKELNLEPHIIPCLCPATNVVKAIEWLEFNGKRIECDNPNDWESVKKARDKAETRHSKDVGKHWKEQLLPALLDLDPTDELVDKHELIKIHGLRKFYVLYYVKGLGDMDARRLAAKILCHSHSGEVPSDTYVKEFKLA